MVQSLPLFPLNVVAFPGEKLNLHIFEPRYMELIKDCLNADDRFGIPSYIKNKIEFGASVRIVKVEKIYEDGRMDISTRAEQVFKVIRFENPYPHKLYAKGKVKFIDLVYDNHFALQEELIEKTKELFSLMKVKEFALNAETHSFDIAHHVGMSIDQEYELLQLTRESERQRYLIDHLDKLLPTLKEVENTKRRIKMNGHFKRFDPTDF